MMDVRIGALLLGGVIGFVLGYIVRSLREIREKVEEVDKHLQHPEEGVTSEGGWARTDILKNIALFLVIVMVAFSAFRSQVASNSSDRTSDSVQAQQDRSDNIVACNNQYLTKTIAALNARTAFAQEQSDANIALQRSQAKFLGTILSKPAPSPETSYKALNEYYSALGTFTTVAAKSSVQVQQNPYPTATEFLDCVNNAKGK